MKQLYSGLGRWATIKTTHLPQRENASSLFYGFATGLQNQACETTPRGLAFQIGVNRLFADAVLIADFARLDVAAINGLLHIGRGHL